jgi:hypothetical protein
MSLEGIEVRAWSDLYDAAPSGLAGGLGLVRELVADASVFRARLPSPLFNRTFGMARLAGEILDATVPGAYLQVPPALLDASGRSLLDARGFQPRTRWVKLTRPPGALAPVESSLRIVEADASQADVFGKTLCAAYGMPEGLAPWNAALVGRPGWRCYLAVDGDVPVGTAALFLDGDVAWLGAAATLPTQRRRGGQRALIARRVADAGAAGARLLVSETGLAPDNPSLRNLLAAGFVVAYERENYVR